MTMPMYVPGMPRIATKVTASHRIVFRDHAVMWGLSSGRIIAGGASRDPGNTSDIDKLRAGVLMGKISSVVNSLGTVGYYAPSILGVTTNAEAVGSTSIEAGSAVVTEVARRIGSSGTFTLVGPPSASGVVSRETVTFSAASGTTLTVTAIANAFIAGSLIMPTDGSENPVTVIPDGYGIKVTDTDNSTNLDVPFAEFPVGGVLDASQLVNWPSDTSLQQWIIGQMSENGMGKFVFDSAF